MNVETFISKPIVDQVWVKGYIVGSATGANGKKRYDFEPPFDHDTALLLADDPATADLSHVVSVCLTSCSKKIREELNLKEHPENRGKVLSVFGFRETYLAIPGIKKIDAYEFRIRMLMCLVFSAVEELSMSFFASDLDKSLTDRAIK